MPRLARGSADRWHDHYSEAWTAKGTYSFYGGRSNQLKTGFDLSFTEMQLIELKTKLGNPPDGKLGIREDIFVAHPIVGAAFFQDTIDYRGLIVNAGVRADFWAPGREVEHVMAHNRGLPLHLRRHGGGVRGRHRARAGAQLEGPRLAPRGPELPR